MAHDVTFVVPARPVAYKDIVFKVTKNGKKFGELRVSEGAVVWKPVNKQRGYRLSWDQLDRLARDNGRKRKVGF